VSVPFCTPSARIARRRDRSLYGEDEDERGRRSGIPRFFENGCEGEGPLRGALQKRASATD
jgi:hypothetical protein